MPDSAWTALRLILLLAVMLAAAWAIRLAGAGLRGQLEDMRKVGPSLTPEQVAAITSQGLATAEQLFAMKPKEQQMLALTAMALRDAQNQRRTREQ